MELVAAELAVAGSSSSHVQQGHLHPRAAETSGARWDAARNSTDSADGDRRLCDWRRRHARRLGAMSEASRCAAAAGRPALAGMSRLDVDADGGARADPGA